LVVTQIAAGGGAQLTTALTKLGSGLRNGAAGAPGGDLDDACAHAGLSKIKNQLK
jgi:hypothetical protein